jgi:hypothetical protein
MAVAIAAVSIAPWRELAAAPGPLTEVMNRAAPSFPSIVFAGITLFAVANTALVNYVTASRLIYGMERQHLCRCAESHPPTDADAPLGNPRALGILTHLVMFGSIGHLASATVLMLFVVFAVVNVAMFIPEGG